MSQFMRACYYRAKYGYGWRMAFALAKVDAIIEQSTKDAK